ncbi:MAG: hypothetical protein H0W76_25800, partial [Pyrinomonadaceae bacterium]|nr:hypothetical protein [Pyrinomonadaceae bacterium]
MQESLFSDPPPAAPDETLDDINAEMVRRAMSLPQFKERVFIFSEGQTGARVAVVG